MQMDEIYIYTDGGSRGNPGLSAIGVVIFDKNKNILKEHKEFIGQATNNVAEYKAIIKGLELGAGCCRKNVFCFSDSELVVNQLKGKYKVKKKHLAVLWEEVKRKEKVFEKVSYRHVRRSDRFISIANGLVWECLGRSDN